MEFKQCVNPGCKWGTTCRLFTPKEAGSVVCLCLCFQNQHEPLLPPSFSETPSLAPKTPVPIPSANFGPSSFVNRFSEASRNMAKATASSNSSFSAASTPPTPGSTMPTERLANLTEQRTQHMAFDPLVAGITSKASSKGKRGSKNPLVTVHLLFLPNTPVIDAWANYDPNSPSSEPNVSPILEPTPASFPTYQRQDLVRDFVVNRAWSQDQFQTSLQIICHSFPFVLQMLRQHGSLWGNLRIGLPVQCSGRRGAVMSPHLPLSSLDVNTFLT
ncbi:hypothetical protein DL93DRAFT_582419 [Clavulina sp. PMI_390]|nr:hypothetical protein DL93DRAFT_582419 [Clavulina sp. PMI_390]